jgi:hypothetical protein
MTNQIMLEDANTADLAPVEGKPAGIEARAKGSRALLVAAYTFLILWGVAYLVLFFTDRLPV